MVRPMISDEEMKALREAHSEEDIQRVMDQAQADLDRAESLLKTTPDSPLEEQVAELREFMIRMIVAHSVSDDALMKLIGTMKAINNKMIKMQDERKQDQ